MNLQFYETMQDKSKEYLSYLIEQISPKFTNSELNLFLEVIAKKPTKKSKTQNSKLSLEFVKLGEDKEKTADLSKLNNNQLKIFFQIFISRELNDILALKWRFYQYIKYHLGLDVKTVKINRTSAPEQYIDFIIETKENETIIVSCYDLLELSNFKTGLNKIAEFAKKQNKIPDRVIISAIKSFRNIPIDEPFNIGNTELKPELWIEWIEENRPFNKEDLLIVNNSDLKIAGFNFTNTEDLLNFVYKYSNGGQVSIFKQSDFYVEANEDNPEIELIWKGIMLK